VIDEDYIEPVDGYKYAIVAWENARWCVDRRAIDVRIGDVIGVNNPKDVEHFLNSLNGDGHQRAITLEQFEQIKAEHEAEQKAVDDAAAHAKQTPAETIPVGQATCVDTPSAPAVQTAPATPMKKVKG